MVPCLEQLYAGFRHKLCLHGQVTPLKKTRYYDRWVPFKQNLNFPEGLIHWLPFIMLQFKPCASSIWTLFKILRASKPCACSIWILFKNSPCIGHRADLCNFSFLSIFEYNSTGINGFADSIKYMIVTIVTVPAAVKEYEKCWPPSKHSKQPIPTISNKQEWKCLRWHVAVQVVGCCWYRKWCSTDKVRVSSWWGVRLRTYRTGFVGDDLWKREGG